MRRRAHTVLSLSPTVSGSQERTTTVTQTLPGLAPSATTALVTTPRSP